MEDTTGVIGSGSCVTLPINISTSNNNKDPPVNTLHAIGSMAVNSISKTKHLTNKSNNRKGVLKEGALNGHPSDLTKGDDSSSSDQDRGELKDSSKNFDFSFIDIFKFVLPLIKTKLIELLHI